MAGETPDFAYEQRLEAAFGHAERPVQITPCGCNECEYLAESLRDVDWRTMSRALAANVAMHLPLLGREAFQYFLPALLRFAYADPWGEEAYWLAMVFRNGFEDEAEPEDLEYVKSRVEGLGPKESLVVLQFLQRMNFEDTFADDDDSVHRRVLDWWRRAATSEPDSVT